MVSLSKEEFEIAIALEIPREINHAISYSLSSSDFNHNINSAMLCHWNSSFYHGHISWNEY